MVMTTAAVGVIAWFLRGLREDVDAMKLDLARNYVTHDQLKALKRDQKRTFALLMKLQLQLARHFKFPPVAIDEDEFEGEDS
jgi:hypothetical protein